MTVRGRDLGREWGAGKGEGQKAVHTGYQELKWLLFFVQRMHVQNDSTLKYMKNIFLQVGTVKLCPFGSRLWKDIPQGV